MITRTLPLPPSSSFSPSSSPPPHLPLLSSSPSSPSSPHVPVVGPQNMQWVYQAQEDRAAVEMMINSQSDTEMTTTGSTQCTLTNLVPQLPGGDATCTEKLLNMKHFQLLGVSEKKKEKKHPSLSVDYQP